MRGRIGLKTREKRLARSRMGDTTVIALLVVTGCFMALPLVYTVVSSFKPFEEIFLFPPRFFVQRPTLDNFTNLFIVTANSWVPFSRYIFNSVFVSVFTTAAYVLVASMAAYPLAKHNCPGKGLIFNIIILSLLFTPKVTYIPQYIIMAKLGWINTYLSLILPPMGAALGVFLMKQFMEQIPTALIESARIDGSGELRTFFTIIMPNVKPAWLTLVIFTFQAIWNNNGGAFIFDEAKKMLPMAFMQIAAGGLARFGVSMAASVLLLIPPIIAFIFTQANVIQTMSQAGIKE